MPRFHSALPRSIRATTILELGVFYHMIWLFSNFGNMNLMRKQLTWLKITDRVLKTTRETRQRVSSWQTICRVIPQRSIPGPPIFNILMNNLHCAIKHTTLSTVCWRNANFLYGRFSVTEVEVVCYTAVFSVLRRFDSSYKKLLKIKPWKEHVFTENKNNKNKMLSICSKFCLNQEATTHSCAWEINYHMS